MCLISLPLGVIYSKKGRQSSCDIFPLGVYSRHGMVDNMCSISLPLGVIYSKKGRQSLCDIFPLAVYSRQGRVDNMCLISLPLGAFSRRGELLLKPLAF